MPQRGDWGTIYRARVLKEDGTPDGDIALATSLVLIFRDPDGAILEVEAELTTDGTDGLIEAVLGPSQLARSGTWAIQGYVELADGAFSTSWYEFPVYRNLEAVS